MDKQNDKPAINKDGNYLVQNEIIKFLTTHTRFELFFITIVIGVMIFKSYLNSIGQISVMANTFANIHSVIAAAVLFLVFFFYFLDLFWSFSFDLLFIVQ